MVIFLVLFLVISLMFFGWYFWCVYWWYSDDFIGDISEAFRVIFLMPFGWYFACFFGWYFWCFLLMLLLPPRCCSYMCHMLAGRWGSLFQTISPKMICSYMLMYSFIFINIFMYIHVKHVNSNLLFHQCCQAGFIKMYVKKYNF